jgi:hypothetical protein
MRAIAIVVMLTVCGAARADAPVQPPPCTAEPTVLPQPRRECTPSPCASRRLRIGRIALEAVMGTGLGAVPIVAGAYIGLSIDVARASGGGEAGTGFYIGTAIGASLGVGSAVYLAGWLMNGDGAYGWAVLGSTAGTALGAGLLAAKSNNATLVFAAALPIAGAITGYELSSHRRRARSAAATLAPAIGRNTIGIAGAF